MNETPANPVFVFLLFVLRCLVPLAILLGVSYLLRRFGLVAETPELPDENDEDDDISSHNDEESEGGVAK